MNTKGTKQGKVSWKSPSNIALIKYWGKHGNQLPRNPSISITLRESVTITEMEYDLQTEGLSIDFYFEGKRAKDFEARMHKFLTRQSGKYTFLKNIHLKINSSNTFPHSSGIASSASAFSALALCVMSTLEDITGTELDKLDFFREASELARLGSGSASRSVYEGYVVWGAHPDFPDYSDNYAVPVKTTVHEVFQKYHDAILIVSGEKKKVGSSAGHSLMENHPFANARYQQAYSNLKLMHKVLETGDLDQFIEIVENEALSLHGLMMSSNPGYLLMHFNTMRIIEIIREFRAETNIPICFTLDAGPNVHLLYPDKYRNEALKLIESKLIPLCDNGKWIDDGMGEGPLAV